MHVQPLWNRQHNAYISLCEFNTNTTDHESTATKTPEASIWCIHSCLSFKMTWVGIVLVRFILKFCQVFANFVATRVRLRLDGSRPNMHSIEHTHMPSCMPCTHRVVSWVFRAVTCTELISLTPLTAKIQFLVRIELSCPHLTWLWSSLNGSNRPLGAAPLNTSEHFGTSVQQQPLTAGSWPWAHLRSIT